MPGAEELLPEPVDEDAGRERVVRRRRASAPGRAGSAAARRRRPAAAGSAARRAATTAPALVLPVAARQDAGHQRRHGLRDHRVAPCRRGTRSTSPAERLDLGSAVGVRAGAEQVERVQQLDLLGGVRCPGSRPAPRRRRRRARLGRRGRSRRARRESRTQPAGRRASVDHELVALGQLDRASSSQTRGLRLVAVLASRSSSRRGRRGSRRRWSSAAPCGRRRRGRTPAGVPAPDPVGRSVAESWTVALVGLVAGDLAAVCLRAGSSSSRIAASPPGAGLQAERPGLVRLRLGACLVWPVDQERRCRRAEASAAALRGDGRRLPAGRRRLDAGSRACLTQARTRPVARVVGATGRRRAQQTCRICRCSCSRRRFRYGLSTSISGGNGWSLVQPFRSGLGV